MVLHYLIPEKDEVIVDVQSSKLALKFDYSCDWWSANVECYVLNVSLRRKWTKNSWKHGVCVKHGECPNHFIFLSILFFYFFWYITESLNGWSSDRRVNVKTGFEIWLILWLKISRCRMSRDERFILTRVDYEFFGACIHSIESAVNIKNVGTTTILDFGFLFFLKHHIHLQHKGGD